MSEYIPKYPSKEGDDSNKTSSELLAETLKPIYVPQDLMLAWESHLASYSRDTNVLLDQVKDSEDALNTQYQALLARVQKYEQMLQDITMDSNEFTMDSDVENFTGWNILAQASYWDYLLKKEITKLSDKIKGIGTRGELVSDITDEILEGLVADNNYISNVIEALSNTPLIQELDAAINSTSTSLSDLQAEYVRLAEKQAADAAALADQLVENAEQLLASTEAALAEQLDRLAEEAAIRTQLLQELEAKTDAMTAEYTAVVDTLHTTVIQELTSLQDGITTSVSELKSADAAIITNLDAYKVSNGQNIAALQNSIDIVTNAQESTASQVTGLIATYDQLDLGLSQAQADIITSNQARAAGDEALSQQITTINAGLGNANSRIDTVSESVSTLDSATATKFSALNTELIDVNTSVASARQIADSAVTANTAQASEINALNARMSTTEGNVTNKADATALSNLETKVDNADAALSIRIDSLVANLTTPDGTEIDANAFNALRAEVLTNSGNITTHTSQITALNSSLNGVNTGLSANADAVANLTTKVTQQGESITSNSQAIQQLQSDLDVAEAGLTTKLDSSVIVNYYTKQQADDKAQQTAAGQITDFKASLKFGAKNLLKDSGSLNSVQTGGNGTVTDGVFSTVSNGTEIYIALDTHEELDVGKYTLSVYVNSDGLNNGITVPYKVGGAAWTHYTYYEPKTSNGWVRLNFPVNVTTKGVVRVALDNFYNATGTLSFKMPQLERGEFLTDWSPSEVDTQAALNANATAIQATNSEVTRVDGKTATNTNAITGLTSRMGTVEGAVSTKLDASAINNYYTKAESDDKSAEIAAGKIESYDANLVIGGANLALNTGRQLNQVYWAVTTTSPLIVGKEYTLSFDYIGNVNGIVFLNNSIVKNYPAINSTTWVRASVTFVFVKNDYQDYELFPHVYGATNLRNLKLEVGNKATDWTPNDQEVQQSINANANAIQTVTAEVSRINGEVVATANSVSTLSSNVGLLQGSINEVRQTVTNNQESTNTLVTSLRSGMADADDVSMMMRNATVLYEDLNFRNGTNGVSLYNNYANGALALNFTDKLPDNPVASTRQLQFIHVGGATEPALGGFYQLTYSRPNGVFLVKFVAKLPVGFSFDLTANAYGDGANAHFIGGNEGTGKFKTYYGVYRCGSTGSFSTVGFVAVNGTQPTAGNPLIWYLASSTVYDCLDSKVAPDSVINGIAEAKTTASTAVTKSEATALLAQNLQASLDSTNANIATNYYTKAEADNVVAGKVEKFSSSVLSSNENLFKGDLTTIYKTTAHGITFFNWDGSTVFDCSAGNSNWVVLALNISPYTINNNNQYGGPVTVSMDYMIDYGTNAVLPAFYFGHGYQSFVSTTTEPLTPQKWVRISTTFYTDANFLLSNPHLGLGAVVGRVFIRNLKVERGMLTAYSADIRETTKSINGIEAIKTVTIDNNGVMSGYGLISQLKNGQVTSAFGVNADTFYIGAPYLNKKPFIHRNDWSQIDGVWVPPGTYIDTALIANATIGTAKIADAAIGTAHIKDAAITNAKIGSLDASKITTGTLNAARISVDSLSAISATIGTLRTKTSGSRLEIRDNIIEVFDANGVVRVQLGIF